ncbi:MAG: DUF6049 family protein [Lapillicoccus sp.]
MTPRRGRPARWAALLFLTVLLGSTAATASASGRPAGSASPHQPGYASVHQAAPAPTAATDTSVLALGAISPPVAGPGVTVTVTGSVIARTARLEDPTVRVVLGVTPVGSRAAVEAWSTSSSAPGGLEVESTRVGRAVNVGTSAPFTITIPPGRFQLNRTFGSIPVAIQVRDTATSTSEVTHTFVGWQRSKQYEPIRLAVVAPVTLSPSAALFDTDTTVRTAAWTAELGAGSRINRILDGTDVDGTAGPVPVTWAVDPGVLPHSGGGPLGPDPAASARSGSAGAGPTGPDPLVPVVAPLLTRLATGAGRHTLWALPQADPDLAATVVTSPNDPTVAAEVTASAALGQRLGVATATGIAWPVDGSFEATREAGLRKAYASVGLQAVVGSSSALPVTSGFTGQAPRRTGSGVTLLAWDDVMSRLSTETTTAAEGALTTQRLVAETAVILAESPGVARTFLMAMPRTLNPDVGALRQVLGTMAQTPWVQFVGTGELLQQAATQDPVASTSKGSWAAAGDPQVDAARLSRITEERRTTGEIASVLGENGEAFRTQLWTMLDQLPSVRWRASPVERNRLDGMVGQAAGAATRGISVAPQTTNFLADEGTLQVTVVNELGVTVDGVRLLLNPTNPRLRIVSQPDPIQVAANSKAVVPVRAEAVAAGLVTVSATLTTEDGTPIGLPGTITVRANPPGYTFYIVGGLIVALILVFGIVRTLRRSRTTAGRSTLPPVATRPPEGAEALPVPPEGDGEIVAAGTPQQPIPEDPTLAAASPVPAPDAGPRRMTDDRT